MTVGRASASALEPRPGRWAGDAIVAPMAVHVPGGRPGVPAEYGRLVVPERHADPDGPVIELPFVRLTATTQDPGPPIVHLAGGPGGSGLEDFFWNATGFFDWLLTLRELGDVVGLDQRGVGAAVPALDACEGWDVPLDEPGDRDGLLAVAVERSERLRAFWTDRGVRLDAYTTPESADDIDALRRALGAERIRLWGESYGTHLATEVIRRHGEHVDRAVLCGYEGPDHTYKLPSQVQQTLDAVAALARESPALGGRLPDLVGLLEGLLGDLEDRPRTVDLRGTRVTVGAFDLQSAVAGDMGTNGEVRWLPHRLLAMAGGDFGWLAQHCLEERRERFTNAVYWLMDSASGATPERRRRIAAERPEAVLSDVIDFPFPAIECAWTVVDLGDDYRSPPVTAVPTLFVSGTLDARTPPGNVEAVLDGFSAGHHLVVEHGGHDTAFEAPEARRAARRFFAGEDPGAPRASVPFTFAEP